VHRPENGKKHEQRRVAQIAGNASSQKEKKNGDTRCDVFILWCDSRTLDAHPAVYQAPFFIEFFFNDFVSLPSFYSL
jgi:hypothetical protein